jgi:hypothetical protein
MFFRGSHIRKHQRHAYLQFITFFPLGSEVADGSRRAICVNLSDSGMRMYTPDRLRKGQVILFNDPLPVQWPKATVRWVKEYRMTGRFYKSGIMFSSRTEEDSGQSSGFERGDMRGPSSEGVEKSTSLVESANFALPAGNYRVASSDDFWSSLTELSGKEADQFIALTSEVMLHETMKDDVWLRFLRAIALFRKARIVFSRQGERWDDSALGLVEKSLADFRAADELAGSAERFPHTVLEENRDAAAKALEGDRPGRAQQILGKTKLAYLGDRLYLRNRQYAPSGEEMAIFEKIFFHYPDIVRSAEIFYKVLGEPGKRYINVLLYKETSPRNAAGEANDPLCIIELVEDGTFHLLKDLVAGAADAEVLEEVAEGSKPEYEGQPGLKVSRAGGKYRKKVKLLVACAVLLLLMITLFLLKSYPPKSLSEPKKEVIPGLHPPSTQESAGPSSLLSEPTENRSSITPGPGSSDKVKVHKSRAAAGVTGRKKKRSQKTKANEEGQTITNSGRTTGAPSPEIKRRSFPPHSRDDL